MENEISKLISREGLIVPGNRILVAVSGGPDSVCLLHLLHRLQDSLGFEVGVAHINHGFRGEESDREEDFVRRLSKELSVPVFVHSEDVAARGRRLGMSFEMTARQVRFDFFDRIMKEEGYHKTALAHHRNDQVETILHRLIRGAGLNGLAGMRIQRDGKFIRPLLQTPRARILEWLDERNLEYKMDSSNESQDYTRNRIRLRLIPELEAYNPDIVSTIGAMSQSLGWDRVYLEETAAQTAKDLIRQVGDKVVISENAFKLSRAISSRLIFIALEKLRGSRLDLSVGQIVDLLELADGQTGRRLDLKEVVAANHYGRLEFCLKETRQRRENLPQEVVVDITKLPVTVDFAPYRITFSSEPEKLSARIDGDRLGAKLIVRRRRPQDRLRLIGMEGHKKVQRIFIDRKIHRDLRDQLPIITNPSGEILFIHPEICAEPYRITPKTAKILYITVMENNNND